jgi:hypothetical protein
LFATETPWKIRLEAAEFFTVEFVAELAVFVEI